MKPSSLSISFRLLLIQRAYEDERWKAAPVARAHLAARCRRAFEDSALGLLTYDEEAALAVVFASLQGVVRG